MWGTAAGASTAKLAKLEDNPEAKRKKLLDVLLDAPLLSQADRDLVSAFASGENKLTHHPKYSAEAARKAVAGEMGAAGPAATTEAESSSSSSLPPPPRFPGLSPGVSPKLQFELRLETPKVAVGIGGGGLGSTSTGSSLSLTTAPPLGGFS